MIKENKNGSAGRPKPKLKQEEVVSFKYEQLMATSFIPELSVLEKRIKELNKMPD